MTRQARDSIITSLQRRAAGAPGDLAFEFIEDAGEVTSLTYAALDRAARRTAGWLRAHRLAGERVILLYPPGLDYIVSFLGCLYARAIAVPAYSPSTHSSSTLRAIVADAGAKAALFSTALRRKRERFAASSPELRDFIWLNTDAMPADVDEHAQAPDVADDTIAYLQYTSGSTDTPKGVIVTHANLAHNIAWMQSRCRTTPDDVQVSWLPPYHDLGLVTGILSPLQLGFPTILMSPSSFAQRPLRWLETMSARQASLSGGPNFAYDLCVSRTTQAERDALDLRRWRVAFIGSEPVRPQTLERFSAAFAPAGFHRRTFYPGYGLAEATLLVTGGSHQEPTIARFDERALRDGRVIEPGDEADHARELVGCGTPADDQRVAIVNADTGEMCEAGQVGEIWVSGPSVTRGYWCQPDHTARTFLATARGLDGTAIGPFLRTADLGFMHDGELFVAGRLKDVIIIRGRNYYAEDVEQTVTQTPLPLTPLAIAAFAADVAGEERLAIAIEVDHRVDEAAVQETARRLGQEVADRYGIAVHMLALVRRGTLPRTTSGKIRRRACARAMAEGSLKTVGEWKAHDALPTPAAPVAVAASAYAIEEWLASRIAAETGLDARALDVRASLSRYGLDSIKVVAISGDLAAWLGRDVAPTLIYEYPSVRAIANHLGGGPHAAVAAPAAQSDQREPIAITGMSLRFPGATTPAAFWELLRCGGDGLVDVPSDRHNVADFFAADAANPGARARHGGFLSNIGLFDAGFFQISPREAMCLDPQQRMLLEVAAEALDDAGESPPRLSGSRTGVFVGISNSEYGALHLRGAADVDAYLSAGNALSVAANRISYVWDFRGPSLAVDTACSSSLVAVHLACRSLWSGESTLALAGGSNLILSPAVTVSFSKAGATSLDGRCKPFDATADGIVRSEGVAVIVLKPLTQALAAGDRVYAVIRGTAVNQDGRTNGLAAPNPQAQEAVLREAYRAAGISPGEVDYIEAHGTGTLLGDPIEAKALGAVIASGRSPGRVCAIGSVKGNIGHAEAAAGIAGLIKVALALRYREIPPTVNFTRPNPYIAFDEIALRVPHTLEPWPSGTPAVAGVSSFGFGGTNAHVVVQAAPGTEDRRATSDGDRPVLLPISARHGTALRQLAERFRDLLAQPGRRLFDVCAGASLRRAHYDHRLAVVATSAEQAVERLNAYLQHDTHATVSAGRLVAGRPRRTVFVFSGYGGQWWAMGRKLLEREPVFKATLEECDAVFRRWRSGSLIDEFGRPRTESRFDARHLDVTQTALFALQIALAELWKSFGIVPDAIVGHSGGEIAAACVAGVLTLPEAAQLCAERGRLLQEGLDSGCEAGRMMAAQLSIVEARALVDDFQDRASVAVHNGPKAVVLTGDTAALEEIARELERRGAFCRMIATPGAGHNARVTGIAEALVRTLEGLSPKEECLPIYSTVTGARARGADFDREYWGRNLRQPVLFADAIEALLADGYDLFVELNAHPIVAASIADTFAVHDRPVTVLPSLRQREDDRAVMLKALGALYASGHEVTWTALYGEQAPHVDLPAYPWQHTHFWTAVDDLAGPRRGAAASEMSIHPLLGRRLTSAQSSGEHFWETDINTRRFPYLEEHRVGNTIVFPGAGYIEMAVTAAREIHGDGSYTVANVAFRRALTLTAGQSRTIQTILSASGAAAAGFEIWSRHAGSTDRWILHATGDIARDLVVLSSLLDPMLDDSDRASESGAADALSGASFYEAVATRGVQYGPTFQGVKELYVGSGTAVAVVEAPDAVTAARGLYLWHPALLDACLHVLYTDLLGPAAKGLFGLPTRIDEIRLLAPPTRRMRTRGRVIRSEHSPSATADVQITDEDDRLLAEIRGYTIDELTNPGRMALNDPARWLYDVAWPVVPFAPRETTADGIAAATWVILEDGSGIGAEVARILDRRGVRVVRIAAGDRPVELGDLRFQVEPERAAQLRVPFDAAWDDPDCPCRIVLHLWNLDLPDPVSNEASWTSSHDMGCMSLAFVAQELLRRRPSHVARLWTVTRGAQRVAARTDSAISVAQVPAWGFGRSLAQECQAQWGGLVDLDPATPPRDAAAVLVDEIIGNDGEDQIAFAGTARHAARLTRLGGAAAASPRFTWRRDATYLVTGGLGRVGPLVLRWMVSQGARRLLLVGRTRLPRRNKWRDIDAADPRFRQIGVIREIESLGASVHLAPADVGNRQEVAASLEAFAEEGWPPIRGVIHAAGCGELQPVQEMDRAALAAVLRPKVLGAWWLHQLLIDEPLDTFVLFSSFMSVINSPLLSHYAAANAFLDGLAHYRRAQGRPALSVNWGLWADPLMQKRFFQTVGVDPFPPDQALELLGALLGNDAAQLAIARVDWSSWRDIYPQMMQAPLLQQLALELAEPVHGVSDRRHELRTQLAALPRAEREALLRQYVSGEIAATLGVSVETLSMDQPISALGIDSMTALELKRQFESRLGVTVHPMALLAGPTIGQLPRMILDEWDADVASRAIAHAEQMAS